MNSTTPAFVLSLDFELMWGVRDHSTIDSYGRNILGGRRAIPRKLELFERNNISATWATVGFVFFESKDELISALPEIRPTYLSGSLSNYNYISDVGKDEASDPYYLGGSLVRSIASCPGQEIGSHTFSHYYCLEAGQTTEQFEADMDAAIAVAASRGVRLKSFVFPRNQFSSEHLDVLKSRGVQVIRGNETSWIYEAHPGQGESKARRIARLADSYVNLSGHHVSRPSVVHRGLKNVPASRFLRPVATGALAPAEGLRLHRIRAAMTHAAQNGGVFHLWWHPHNFGGDVERSMDFLGRIVAHFNTLRDEYGMISAAMGDFA